MRKHTHHQSAGQQAMFLLNEINQYLGGNRGWERCLKLLTIALTEVVQETCVRCRIETINEQREADAEKMPSREALPAILGGHCSTVMDPEQFYDKLMAWATGQPVEKTWCPHIGSTTFMGKTVWLYKSESVPPGVVFGMNFDQCPICAVPRPTDA